MSDNHHNQSSPPKCTVNPYEYLQIVQNTDGSITRLFQFPSTPAASDHHNSCESLVLTKDVQVNAMHNTWLRIFLPRQALDNSTTSATPTTTTTTTTKLKLPLVVFYHGGGFILGSASWSMFHDFCEKVAIKLGSIVVSVGYRLAPEHRLPAAYNDAIDVLNWIKCSTNDKWLTEHADFSKCFLMGISAGGNIAYHAGLRVASSKSVNDLEPLKIQGLILIQPFFGGSERTGSEVRLINDPALPLSGSDLMWELSLPIGADRNHEYCNPTVGDGFDDNLGDIKRLGFRILVTGCDGDPLIDRQIELVKMLEMKGVDVVAHFGEGGYHGEDVMGSTKPESLFVNLKKFIEHK